MEFENISITSGQTPSSEGLPIRWDLYSPISRTNREFPVILFLHGFKGFKDWGPFPDACEEIARSGFAVVAINFSLNGIGTNKREFDRLDLFARETFTQDIQDIKSIIDALQKGEINDTHSYINTDVMGVLGHSRGGQTAIVAASKFASIQCLVTWSAVANYLERWSDGHKKDWEEKGFTEFKNGRTGQIMKLDRVVYEDALDNQEEVLAIHRVKELRVPSLFIHARQDETVPYTDSEELHINCATKEKELRLIANTGHTLGTAHPFEEEDFPAPFMEALEWSIGWFREYLR